VQNGDSRLANAPILPRRIGVGLRVGYGVGQLGAQILKDLPNVLMPSYVTLVLGLAPALMSVIIFIPKIWVMIWDPIVGALSDRTDTRIGRRRPFLLLGALLCPLALIALFYDPGGSAILRIVYATLAFGAVLTASSVFSVPYLCLGAEMSGESHERMKLMAMRMVFLATGLVVGVGASQPLIAAFGGGARGYWMLGLTLAAVCFASMLACFLATRSAYIEPSAHQPFSVREQIAVLRGNRPFTVLCQLHFIQLLSSASTSTAFLFFMIYVSGHPLLLLPMTMLNAVVIISTQPLWVRLSGRLGAKPAYLIAVCSWSAVSLTWMLVKRDSVALLSIPWLGSLTVQDVEVLARYMLVGVFNSGMTLLSVTMLTDTIDYARRRSGVTREGAFVGAWSALEKVALAAGPLWIGPFLQAFGFRHASGEVIAQSATAILGIRLAAAGIPAVLCLLTIPLILRYPLGHAKRVAPQTAAVS
jgi:GPH family glycoside/pentoside/hexuronide:cation symporter